MSETAPFGVFRADIDGDGQVTLGDLTAWAVDVFFVPGNWLIGAARTQAPAFAGFLELDRAAQDGMVAGALSAVLWFAALVVVIWACGAVSALDRALTDFFVQTYRETRRKLRIASTLLVYRLRRLLPRRSQEKPDVLAPRELEISEQELLALRLHLGLAPGYALAVSEVAGALDVGRSEARRILDRLLGLQLLCTTLGGCEGESAYTLAPGGRLFLASLKS